MADQEGKRKKKKGGIKEKMFVYLVFNPDAIATALIYQKVNKKTNKPNNTVLEKGANCFSRNLTLSIQHDHLI